MRYFRPARVFVREEALRYPLAHQLIRRFEHEGIPVKTVKRVTGIPGETTRQGFFEAKRTLVLAVRQNAPLQGCGRRPTGNCPLSAVVQDIAITATSTRRLAPSRISACTSTSMTSSPKPKSISGKRAPMVTVFEGSATSDPVPLERWTGHLRRAIEHFGRHPYGRFRIATKYDGVESLLDADHRGHTRKRFTVNSERVIGRWDKATAGSGGAWPRRKRWQRRGTLWIFDRPDRPLSRMGR